MRTKLITLAFTLALLVGFTSCQKLKVVVPEEEPQTDGIGPIVAGFQRTNTSITSQMLGVTNPDEFQMGPLAIEGNYTYIADNTPGDFGILVYSNTEKKVVKTIKEWTVNGTTENFMNAITGMFIANGKLYVSNRRYRVDVFSTSTQEFITTLGDGNYYYTPEGNNLSITFSVAVTGGKVYVRDKKRLVVFKEADVTPANYKKVPVFAQLSGESMADNFNLMDIPMTVTPDGNILIAAYGMNKLYFVDTKKVGVEANWIDESKSVSDLPGRVESVAATNNAYVIIMDEKVYKYTIATKTLEDIGSALELQECNDIYKFGSKIWVSSKGNQIDALNILNR